MQTVSEWPVLEVAVRHRVGGLILNLDIRISKPWTVLFAPSGDGKTTLLRTIAGLIQVEHANIVLAESTRSSQGSIRRIVMADTEQKKSVPAHLRNLPMVPQTAALFPHLSVAENVSYGLRSVARPFPDRPGAEKSLDTLLDLCRIKHLKQERPARLSGGERQRVALARALGADASAVLLDEPFAGLDGTLKQELMSDVKAWLSKRRVPVLHVTHDVGEAFSVADEVIRLSQGKVVAQGPPAIVLDQERKRLLASLGS